MAVSSLVMSPYIKITPSIGAIGAKSIETILLPFPQVFAKYYDQDPGAQHKSTIYF